MIDPQKSAREIILNDPALAKPLFDLLLWADQSKLNENSDYDEILDLLWVKIQKCRDSREAYAKERRAQRPDFQITNETQNNDSRANN